MNRFGFKLLHGRKWDAELGWKGPWKMWLCLSFDGTVINIHNIAILEKRLFWHVAWNRKLTSRRFSAWTKLESGYCSASECAFVTEENTTLQSFQEVHNVVGVLIKEKCLGNWWWISVNEPKEMKHGVSPSMAKYCHGNGWLCQE